MMTAPDSTIKSIQDAATEAGDQYMRDHSEERPEGTAKWTMKAYLAAASVFNRQCRAAGIYPYVLPK